MLAVRLSCVRRSACRPALARLFSGATSPGILNTLLHGVSEKTNLDNTATDSKSLGSTFIYEFLFHSVPYVCRRSYESKINRLIPTICKVVNSNNPSNMKWIGSWSTEIGDLNEFIHIIQYNDYDCVAQSNTMTSSHWSKLHMLSNKTRTEICQAFRFAEAKMQKEFNIIDDISQRSNLEKPIYEMRTYTLHPGKLLEWATHWKLGVEARSEHTQLVGAWFTQLGLLHTVHHMWRFDSLSSREQSRDMAWKQESWANAVATTAGFAQRMKCNILKPLDKSPSK